MTDFSDKDLKLWQWATQGVKSLGAPIPPQKTALRSREDLLSEMESFLSNPSSPVSSSATPRSSKPSLTETQKKANFPLYSPEDFLPSAFRPLPPSPRFQGRIDLHGLTQQDAHDRLKRFLKESFQQQWRRVLVITGKGRPLADAYGRKEYQGTLFINVPRWLSSPPLKRWVESIERASVEDGGDGALYVTIKRNSLAKL